MTTTDTLEPKALAEKLLYLVLLNDPKRGGPYSGIAAEECMNAMKAAASYLSTASIPQPAGREEKPFCWVLPGDDTATNDGWVDARIDEGGEFTKPLYVHPAALVTPPPEVPKQEPVAWRVTQWVDGNSQSMVTEWKETADARRELGEEVEPLYTHPSAPPVEAQPVAVKGLEWGKTSYGTPEAFSTVGVYRINEAANGGWTVVFGGGLQGRLLTRQDGLTNFANIESAKAAAQANYESRILSALTNAGGK